jgi:hypothetical protein
MTPVVVSSVPAITSPSCSRRPRRTPMTSALSSIEVRTVIDRGLDVAVRVVVLALDRRPDAVLLDEWAATSS